MTAPDSSNWGHEDRGDNQADQRRSHPAADEAFSMDPMQYTADAICRSMGLPAFVEPNWTPPTLRLLLLPSFDPEVCITLAGAEESVRLSVVALSDMLWRQAAPCVLAGWRDQSALASPVLLEAISDFTAALVADRQKDGRMAIADGMPVAACLLSVSGAEQFKCHPCRPEVAAFVSSLIQVAWTSCRLPEVRNALASSGKYVGLSLPHEPLPQTQELLRVAILGEPDAKADFFDRVKL